MTVRFEWDADKDILNRRKHGVPFSVAQRVFLDPQIVIAEDQDHSREEGRFYAIGRVGAGILTVRFTYRGEVIRMISAGYWRKGRRLYETQNRLHR